MPACKWFLTLNASADMDTVSEDLCADKSTFLLLLLPKATHTAWPFFMSTLLQEVTLVFWNCALEAAVFWVCKLACFSRFSYCLHSFCFFISSAYFFMRVWLETSFFYLLGDTV